MTPSAHQGLVEVRVSSEPLQLFAKFLAQAHDTHGAENIFFGLVRRINLQKEVIAVEYDCFIPLAEAIFRQIAVEAQERWCKDGNIAIHHRQGYLAVGEVSIAISVTTRHRDESYQMSRYIIEQIKTRAPIWKKEYYHDHESEWVQGHALCQHHHAHK